MISLPENALANVRNGLVPARPFILPAYSVNKNGLNVKLWVAQRKAPFLMTSIIRNQAMLVPVAPDLKMVFGIAKRVRDYGADAVQNEALKAAPLVPGDAFIGSGARYRFANTVLAVIFDENKRTSPEIIARAVRRGCELANQRGCHAIILPDMTENLLAQPTGSRKSNAARPPKLPHWRWRSPARLSRPDVAVQHLVLGSGQRGFLPSRIEKAVRMGSGDPPK